MSSLGRYITDDTLAWNISKGLVNPDTLETYGPLIVAEKQSKSDKFNAQFNSANRLRHVLEYEEP